MNEYELYQLDSCSFAAWQEGFENGTIKDTEEEIVKIVLKQEVVSYCSERAAYTFDINDLVDA